ncbi:DUF3488 and transglutaminase-like domain-containing protein [Synechococcus elongatus IITB4]|uniref:transglutaminase TgpA family protein n=1 Tax=Synechococcus elongatus TaxID=32046 RepID=UPI0030CAB7CA
MTPWFPPRSGLGLLSSGFVIAVLLLLGDLPPVAAFVAIALLVWGLLRQWQKRSLLPQTLRHSLTAIALILALLVGLPQGLLSVFLGLLTLAFALKLLELQEERDYQALVLIAYSLVALGFLLRQSLLETLVLLLAIAMETLGLAALYRPLSRPRQPFAALLRLLAPTVPLLLVLFLIAPRLPPLWGLPVAQRAVTGLSDRVSPGEIAELSRSSALAFRFSFPEASLPSDRFYWRAMVHELTDGRGWQPLPFRDRFDPSEVAAELTGEGDIPYTVIAEPSQRTWRYALELSRPTSEGIVLDSRFEFRTRIPLSQQTRYQGIAFERYQADLNLSPRDRQINLQLPPSGNPQSRAWAQRLRDRFRNDDAALVQASLQELQQQDFRYTLQPPLLTANDSIDDFLFRSRAGFCEHYASSFAFLMRAAGIPARVVTGYLGGEWNPQANYYSVLQANAHAWTEVWLPGQGWQRVDPTAAIAPLRLSEGLQAALTPEDRAQAAGGLLGAAALRRLPLLDQAWQFWASVDYRWTSWVLSYDNQRQQELLAALLAQLGQVGLSLLLVASILIAAGLMWLLSRWLDRRSPEDPSLRIYQQACRAIAKAGWPRQPQEGPSAYAERLASLNQPWAMAFSHLTQQYLAQRYAQQAVPTNLLQRSLQDLRQLLRTSRR